jgi:hypothetical protein
MIKPSFEMNFLRNWNSETSMKNFLLVFFSSLVIFFVSWFVVYKIGLNNLVIQSEDTLPTIFLPVTVLKEGTLYADTYYKMLLDKYPHPDDKSYVKGLVPFYLKKVVPSIGLSSDQSLSPHYITAFPIISGLLAVPIYLIPVLMGINITWENLYVLSHLSSSFIVALSGGFMYLLLKKHFVSSKKKALLLTGVYLFGTVNYALISQALWQHGSVQLFTILGVYFLLNALSNETFDKLSQYFWSGLFIGLAVLSRPTAALSYVLLFSLIYFASRSSIKALFYRTFFYFLGLVPVAVFFIWYNATYFLDIGNQGYSSQLGNSWLSKFPEGFLGVWLSPSKGILIYSPIIIFSLLGTFLVLRKSGWRTNYKYAIFALIVLIHTLVIGKWKHWYGGWSFGYRMSSDIIPYLILMMVPFVESQWFEKFRKTFFILLAIAVLMQIFGIIFFDGVWHAAYDQGFENTSWLWSIKDSEIVFNIRRILVKFNLLEQACPKCLPVN